METLLAIITLIERMNSKRLLQKLFSNIIVVFGLVIITAIMIAATLIGGLINAHIALLNSGMSSPVALLIIGAAALFIIAMLIAVIAWRLRNLRRIPQTLYGRSHFACQAMDTLDAFTAGLMAD